VDRLDRGPAARAGLARAAVDLERHGELVGNRFPDHLLVVGERPAQHLVAREPQPGGLRDVELGALAEGRELAAPEDLVHPGAPDPGHNALVAQQRVEVARLVHALGEVVLVGGGPRVGAEGGHGLVVVDLGGREQLGPGALLGAELAQAQLPPVLEPHEQARGAVPQRGPVAPQLEPPGGHEVHEQRELSRLDHEHLPRAPHPRQLAARERLERRVEGLHRDHPRGERGLDPRAPRSAVEPPRGDLDLGQLGHAFDGRRGRLD
jgi:hypothetical protein